MQIRRIQPPEFEAVRRLLCENGWARRVPDPETFAQLLDASQLAEVAVHEWRIVGFARGITDRLSNGYLSMIVVDPDFRRRGIGRALVAHCLAGHPEITWLLRAGREGAPDFFAKLGFERSSLAMERRRC